MAEIGRKLKVSEATVYGWKEKHEGLRVPQLRKFPNLREENNRLRRLVADLSVDREIFLEALGGRW